MKETEINYNSPMNSKETIAASGHPFSLLINVSSLHITVNMLVNVKKMPYQKARQDQHKEK